MTEYDAVIDDRTRTTFRMPLWATLLLALSVLLVPA